MSRMHWVLHHLEKGLLGLGLLMVGATVLILGLRTHEVTTYLDAVAEVVAVETKCEMSYKTGRRSRTERIVDCRDVASVKARTPEVDWRVVKVTFATLHFKSATGDTVRTSVRTSKIGRNSVMSGERIGVLYSPTTPTDVSAPFELSELALLLPFGGFGLLVLFLWNRLRRSRRERHAHELHSYALALAEQMVQSKTVEARGVVSRTPLPSSERTFGRRAA